MAYFIPAIRRTVVLVEDVDAISSLDRASMQHLEGVSTRTWGRPSESMLAGCCSRRTTCGNSMLWRVHVSIASNCKSSSTWRARAARRRSGRVRPAVRSSRACSGRARRFRWTTRATSGACETPSAPRLSARRRLNFRCSEKSLRLSKRLGLFASSKSKNASSAHRRRRYRDANVSMSYHGLLCEIQIHLEPILAIADQQHVAYEAARELDLMGVLEKPATVGPSDEASSRRPRVGYVLARLVLAVLSAVIGWLYVDALVLKGVDSLVTRASLLPTRGFEALRRPASVRPGAGGAVLDEHVSLASCGRRFWRKSAGPAAREDASRAAIRALLWVLGHAFCVEGVLLQMMEVALQAYGKVPLFLTYMNPFEGLGRGRDEVWVGESVRHMSRNRAFLHVFVILFLSALLVNILYPAVLLRSSDVRYQRDLSFIADTALDIVYAVVPFVFLALGVRSQPMIIPHDPLEYTSNLVPMIHAHFVISTLEAAADESRALRKVAPCEDVGDGSEETVTVSPSSARSRVSRAMYGALIAACLALWVLAFIAVSFEIQLIFSASFVLASLLLPFAARRAGRPSFSVWEPALLCSGLYLLLCLGSRFQSPVLMSFVLVFHGALHPVRVAEALRRSQRQRDARGHRHEISPLAPVGRRNVLLRDGWPSSFDDCRVHAG